MPTLVFTASGTWTPPADWPGFADKIECVGPGGNGSARISSTRAGNGGGGGEYAAETVGPIYITGSKSYTIGTGGSGTSTSFPADSVTVTAHAGGNATNAASGNGGGGTGSANHAHFNGGAGRATPTSTASGGGGGGAGGPSGAGTAAASNVGGAADNSTVSAPAAGNAGNSGTEWTTAGCGTGGSGFASGTNNGTTGGQAGGGGSGASDGGAGSTGGTGGHGLIAVTYTSANLVPTEGSIQVIVYPQPQHFVLAPGRLYYRSPDEIPASTVTLALNAAPASTAGAAGFTPTPTFALTGVAALGQAGIGVPTVVGVPDRLAPATAGQGAFVPEIDFALVSAPTEPTATAAAITPTISPTAGGAASNTGFNGFTPEYDFALVGAPSTAGQNVFVPEIDSLAAGAVSLGFASTFQSDVALAAAAAVSDSPPPALIASLSYILGGAAALGQASQGTVTLSIVPVPGTVLGAVNFFTPGIGFTLVPGSSTAGQNFFGVSPTIALSAPTEPTGSAAAITPGLGPTGAGAASNTGFNGFTSEIDFPAIGAASLVSARSFSFAASLAAVAAVSDSLPSFTAALSYILGGSTAVGQAAQAGQTLAIVPAGGAALAAINFFTPSLASPFGGAATLGQFGLLAPTNFVPTESTFQVIVYPLPRHFVLAPSRLYYHPSIDLISGLSINLQPAAAGGAAGFFTPPGFQALQSIAATPFVEPFVPLVPLPPAAAVAGTDPLSIYTIITNLSAVATGYATPFFGIVVPLNPAASLTGAGQITPGFGVLGAAGLGQGGPFSLGPTLAGVAALTHANDLGVFVPLVRVVVVGQPGSIASLTIAIQASGASSLAQPGQVTPAEAISIAAGLASLGQTGNLVPTVPLPPATVMGQVQPLSTSQSAFVPLTAAITIAHAGDSIGATVFGLVSVPTVGSAANVAATTTIPLTGVLGVTRALDMTRLPTLTPATAAGHEAIFSVSDQVSLLPLAIALGQVADFGLGFLALGPTATIGQAEPMTVFIVQPPMGPGPFYPLGRGRLVGGFPARIVGR